MEEIREKKHRLDPALYVGHRMAAFTLCVKDRKDIFKSSAIFHTVEGFLLSSLGKYNVAAHVYFFMPDHLHMLLEGKDQSADIRKCVVDFKQRSGYWFLKQGAGIRWQKDFYDHILRKDEDILRHVRYILENPLRKGLVEYWKDYPYKGSTLYDFEQW